MVVANEMTKRGHPPARVDLRATCSGDVVGGGWKVTGMDIDLAVAAPGVDEETFREVVAASEQGCPVSNALRGNVEIRVNAKLM